VRTVKIFWDLSTSTSRGTSYRKLVTLFGNFERFGNLRGKDFVITILVISRVSFRWR
jgi:hypothetical protein